jgi:hypothetical protein
MDGHEFNNHELDVKLVMKGWDWTIQKNVYPDGENHTT